MSPSVPSSPFVYVVDDDPSVRRALDRLLRSAGLASEMFASAPEFLGRADLDRHACVVIDASEPGGVNFALPSQIPGHPSGLSFVYVTASDSDEDRRLVRDLGAVAYLRKPVDDQALLDAIWWGLIQKNGPISDPPKRPAPSLSPRGSEAP